VANWHAINDLHVTLAETVQKAVNLMGCYNVHVVRRELQVHALTVIIFFSKLFKLDAIDHAAVCNEDELVLSPVELVQRLPRFQKFCFFLPLFLWVGVLFDDCSI